ncbi:hypothetical protein GCM10007857_88140 [Bradyrhizobium iriomotense]|uniref:Transposase IS66 central domain-containing protein n=1 Tax=Bradyrhizobium iriomotense TaxID=441950 RepID=A0ABQ6BGN2_9BRAD|nr:hypothetical protein GCM10007857_88140 [Bradyrhizobium iriomotense]
MLAAKRLHGDDTTIRILAKGKCTTGRIWTYVRDDRPFAGPAPPPAVYYASSDRRGEHPQRHLAAFAGILQADCYSGFEPLFDPRKKATPITPAFCFAHARRGFFELADIEKNTQEGKKGKPVSPTSSPVSPIFPHRVCTNCCPGNGSSCAKPTSPPITRPPDLHATPS